MKQAWLLTGFVGVAALLGALDWLRAPQHSDSQRIVITKAQQQFVSEQVSQPAINPLSEQNYDQALQTWINDEVLYREGLKLGLDKDDLIVRRRVVQKMRFVLEGMTPLPDPDQAQMQAWLDKHPEQYQADDAVSLEHVFFSRGKRGDTAIEDAKQALSRLQAGSAEVNTLGDAFPWSPGTGTHRREALHKEFGQALVSTLFDLPVGQWAGPFQSGLGVHLLKVNSKVAGRTMTLAEATPRLKADLLAAQRKALNDASESALRSTYTVDIEQ